MKKNANKFLIIGNIFIILTILIIDFTNINKIKGQYKRYLVKGIRQNIIDTVNIMKCYPFVYLSNVKRDTILNSQLRRFIWLYRNATNYELYKLLEYPDPIIKAYAIYILYWYKQDSTLYIHRNLFMYDTMKIIAYDGYIGKYKTIYELFNDLRNEPPPPSLK